MGMGPWRKRQTMLHRSVIERPDAGPGRAAMSCKSEDGRYAVTCDGCGTEGTIAPGGVLAGVLIRALKDRGWSIRGSGPDLCRECRAAARAEAEAATKAG